MGYYRLHLFALFVLRCSRVRCSLDSPVTRAWPTVALSVKAGPTQPRLFSATCNTLCTRCFLLNGVSAPLQHDTPGAHP
ncbi:hypothetical protein PR003_g32809 [Phytophthora rubi]|uniref:Secreted protein n=1 Tax=Phytophthora rubi TaxID=129364 RepID=A0A6A4AXE7_9STRA|nr:hypothetical protein PR003_g32809 [Phytophthora rubi]